MKPATIVGQTPLLNAKADAHNTIYTEVEKAAHIIESLKNEPFLLAADRGNHGNAMEVKFIMLWDECEKEYPSFWEGFLDEDDVPYGDSYHWV